MPPSAIHKDCESDNSYPAFLISVEIIDKNTVTTTVSVAIIIKVNSKTMPFFCPISIIYLALRLSGL